MESCMVDNHPRVTLGYARFHIIGLKLRILENMFNLGS